MDESHSQRLGLLMAHHGNATASERGPLHGKAKSQGEYGQSDPGDIGHAGLKWTLEMWKTTACHSGKPLPAREENANHLPFTRNLAVGSRPPLTNSSGENQIARAALGAGPVLSAPSLLALVLPSLHPREKLTQTLCKKHPSASPHRE